MSLSLAEKVTDIETSSLTLQVSVCIFIPQPKYQVLLYKMVLKNKYIKNFLLLIFFFFHSYWFLCSYSFVFIFLFHYFLILFGFLQLNKYPVFILQVLFFKIPLNLNSLSSNFSPVSYAVVLCFTLCLSALTFFFFLFIFKALQARTISACVKCIIIL